MVVIASRLEAVTVYARGARITRVARLPAGPLPAHVQLAGLPLALVDDSVRVEVTGPAVATSLHVALETPATAETAAAEEPLDLRAARRAQALAEAERERVDAALLQLAGAPVVAAATTSQLTDEPPAAWDAVVTARAALVAARATRELALRDALVAARTAQERARLVVELLVSREARATSARGAKLHEQRKAVAIELAAGAGSGEVGDVELRLEYQVRAARWAPSYVARLDERGAQVELRAVVAQSSGEDWLGAALVLSTAEPAQLAELPELSPQRIGRKQADAKWRGFRPAPSGAEALYADYDRTRTRARSEPPPSAQSEGFAAEVWDDGTSRDKEAFATPPRGSAVPMAPGAAPMAPQQMRPMAMPQAIHTMVASSASARGGLLGGFGSPAPKAKRAPTASPGYGAAGGGDHGAPADVVAAVPPPPVPRLDYAELRMAAPTAGNRGKLVPRPSDPLAVLVADAVGTAVQGLSRLVLPRGCTDSWARTYDYAFAADGRVDVESDGAWHSLAITAKPATVALRHVAVPREQADVFRVAAIANPFDGPLLPGPIDVYDRGQFLVTSEVDATPPGGKVEIGLGVDPLVKISRNTEFREEATGMLRGGLRLVHGLAVDVENLSARAIELEVRERVPVTVAGDDTVEVAVTRVEPAWERWTPDPNAPLDARLRGAYRWRVSVAANGKVALRAGYEVKIASKLELVGGNRRES